jgi:5-methylcytosine-specific restriction endonuclease McrA
VPVSGPDDPRFYELANMQGLCHTCHNAKRQRESRGAGRA